MSTAATTGWRVLPIEKDDPERLLDVSLDLLDGLARHPVPTLRWYAPTSTAIVLGRGQRRLAVEVVDDVRVVVRSSGGGAVLLDDEMLALDVLLPAGDPWLTVDIGDVFAHVGRAWARSLQRLGTAEVHVHPGPSTTPPGRTPRERFIAAICYASVGRGEVLAGGRKLVGLAQRRRRHGALVQCGLLRTWNPQRLLTALGGDPSDPDITTAAVGLNDLSAEPPDEVQVMAAVEAVFTERDTTGSNR